MGEVSVTSSPLRVLHVTKRFWPFRGGVERYVEDLAVAQVARGYGVTVLTIDRDLVGGADVRLPALEMYRGIRITRVPAMGNAKKQIPVGRFRSIARELRDADVVHHHDPRFLYESALAVRTLTRRPLVLHTHGLIWHTRELALLKSIALRCYYGPTIRHFVTAVVASSATDARLLLETAHVAGPRVHVLPNAVDIGRYFNLARRPTPGQLLVFGRIDVHKGLDRLFDALRRVSRHWRLAIVGSGSDIILRDLQAAARHKGVANRVEWRGEVDAIGLESALSQAALAIFPSRFEGFGLALLEALAAGVPIVASDIEAHRALVGHKLTHLLVDMEDPDACAKAITVALERSSVENNRLAALERARAHKFDFGAHLVRLDELYGELGLT